MKRFKLMLSAAVLVAACSATAMAGAPKGDANSIKSEAKAGFTYWVVGTNPDGTYNLVTSQPSPDPCVSGDRPCKIQSSNQHSDLKVSQDDVDNEQNGETILSFQESI